MTFNLLRTLSFRALSWEISSLTRKIMPCFLQNLRCLDLCFLNNKLCFTFGVFNGFSAGLLRLHECLLEGSFNILIVDKLGFQLYNFILLVSTFVN